MKKTIIISTMLCVLSLLNATAQNEKLFNNAVSRSLEGSFRDATNIRMEPFKGLIRCKFSYMGNVWLVFYKKNGAEISRGKLIRSVDQLPILVQSGTLNAKTSLENKFGAVAIVNIYEMISGSITDYYVTLENQKILAVYSVTPQGTVGLRLKEKKQLAPALPTNAIAKRD